jgi:Adenylate and Guanylate cyclase catalytic domain
MVMVSRPSKTHFLNERRCTHMTRCCLENEAHFDAKNDRLTIKIWLRKLHAAFDCLCDDHEVLKVPTNGNAYIVVCRSQGVYNPDEAIKMLHFAVACQKRLHCLVPLIKLDSNDNVVSTMRFGMHLLMVTRPDDKSRHNIVDHESNFKKVLNRATMMQK